MGTIALKAVTKSFGPLGIIHGIDLDIREGEFIVFVGPSGCGKSTLLRLIAGLEDTTSGHIAIDGVDMTDSPASQRGLAMVFQSYALYPHMSVRSNLGFGLKMAGRPKEEIAARVAKAAETLNLTGYLDRMPRQLSGGQRQRVAIGRCIVRAPKAFLFDEPLSNLDAALRAQMRIEILQLHAALGATMVYVTHDQVEAMTMADRIVVLDKGRIEQVGTPLDLYNRPETTFVAGFIGSPKMNFFGGDIAARAGAHSIGVRPEHIRPSAEGPFSGRVLIAEHLGSDTFLHLDCGAMGRLVMRVPDEAPVLPGESIRFDFRPGSVHLFNAQGKAIRP